MLSGIERGEIGAVFLCKLGQRCDRGRIFSGHAAQGEEPLLDALELARIEIGRLQRRLDGVGRRIERFECIVQGLYARLDQPWRLRQSALEAARRGDEQRGGGGFARKALMRLADVGGDLLGLHHRGAALGERLLLAGPDSELGQLLMGVGGEIGLGLRGGDPGALVGQLRLDCLHGGIGRLGRLGLRLQTAVSVDEHSMARCLHQGAVVVLAVDLDQTVGDRARHLRADRLIVDESAGPSIRELDAAQDQFAVGLDVALPRERNSGMIGGEIEDRRHLALRLTVTDERAVAARAERQRQRVEQDRFSRPSLAGQNRQSAGEFEVQLVDQDNVADRKPNEHPEALLLPISPVRPNGRAWRSRRPGLRSARGRRP